MCMRNASQTGEFKDIKSQYVSIIIKIGSNYKNVRKIVKIR